MRKITARFKVWLTTEDMKNAFGDGKWQLLKAIEQKKSLKAVCESTHRSYRKAWGDLKEAENTLDITLVDRKRGGRIGGQTTLTAQGKQFIRSYTKFHQEIEQTVEKTLTKYFKDLKQW